MPGIGTIINVVLVIVGSLLGLLLKKAIPERLKTSLVQALALATMTIGLTGIITASCKANESGTLSSDYIILMVVSMAVGTFIGELVNIEKRLDSMGNFFQRKFSSESSSTFAQGFITASLVFCVGSMAILGSLNDGILHDPTILITKSLLDMVMAMVFASTLGIGVMFSIITVAVYQGLITLCASFVAPYLTETIISQMSFIGSILIMGIGFNFLYEPKLKLGNMLPSMFIPLIWHAIENLAGGLF
ncbi:MAG: DUF554 domain-containing protein [Ruminococcaceae bacterium]|nr:DUF554 domain-containing protein [Oscillospiraceae bacterium]